MQVRSSDAESQKNVAPFLKHRVLRAIVESLVNSPDNGFEDWAKNKEIIASLKEAQRLLDQGYIKEEEMEKALLGHIAKQARDSESISKNSMLVWQYMYCSTSALLT